MKRFLLCGALLAATLLAAVGCKMRSHTEETHSSNSSSEGSPVSGTFTPSELRSFAALAPIDTHTHIRRVEPELNAMLERFNVHILDILLVDDRNPEVENLQTERQGAMAFIHSSSGRAQLCTTIDPFRINDPGFAATAIRDLNKDFANGAIAVKIWKNVGMEIKDARGKYVLPDDPRLEPIYKDIDAHNKTLIAHLADPDSAWAPPNPASPDYSYYAGSPEWYMYGKADAHQRKKF